MSVAHSIDPGSYAIHAARFGASAATSAANAVGGAADDGDTQSGFNALLPSDLMNGGLTATAMAAGLVARAGISSLGNLNNLAPLSDDLQPIAQTDPAAPPVSTARNRGDDSGKAQAPADTSKPDTTAAVTATATASDAKSSDATGNHHAKKGDKDSTDSQPDDTAKSDATAATAATATILPLVPVPLAVPTIVKTASTAPQAIATTATLATTPNAAASDATAAATPATATTPATTATPTAAATPATTVAPTAAATPATTVAPDAGAPQPDGMRFVKDVSLNQANTGAAQPNIQQGPAGSGMTQVKVTTTAAPLTGTAPANPAQAVAAQQQAAPAANPATPTATTPTTTTPTAAATPVAAAANSDAAQATAHQEAVADGRAPATTNPPPPAPATTDLSGGTYGGGTGTGTGTGAGTSGGNLGDSGTMEGGNGQPGNGLAGKSAAAMLDGLAAKAAATADDATGESGSRASFASMMNGSTTASGTAGAGAFPGATLAAGTAPTSASTGSSASTAAQSSTFAAKLAMPMMPADQLADAIQRLAPASRSFSMQMTPDRLGTVDVRLNIDAKGNAKATFTASKPETLVLLQQDSHHLVDALQNAGIQVDPNALSFSLRDGGQGGQQTANFEQSGGGRNGGNGSGQTDSQTGGDSDDAASGQPNRSSSHLYDLHA